MRKLKLSIDQINQVNAWFPTEGLHGEDLSDMLLKKRIYLQQLIATELLKNTSTGKILVEAYTGFGKTFIGRTFIEAFNKSYNEKSIIVTPFKEIAEEWLECMSETKHEYDLHIINSYTSPKFKKSRECGLLIIDEAHKASRTHSSVYFSQCSKLTKSKFQVGLTASLPDNLRDNLEALGFDCTFQIPIEQGLMLGLVPLYRIYNIPVSLSDNEKSEYFEVQTKIDDAIKPYYHTKGGQALLKSPSYLLMAINDVSNPERQVNCEGLVQSVKEWYSYLSRWTGFDEKKILQDSRNLMRWYNNRSDILEQASMKFQILKQLLEENGRNKYGILFSKNTVDCDAMEIRLPSLIKAYHNKIKPKELSRILKEFKLGNIRYIASVGKAVMGLSVPRASLAIQTSFNSTSIDFIQKLGRIARFDKEDISKQAIFINLYVPNFTYMYFDERSNRNIQVDVRSTEANNLKKMLTNQLYVYNVSSINDIVWKI